MINEVLLEHEAPFLDDVEQGLLEGSAVNSEPRIEDMDRIDLIYLVVNLLVGVNLTDKFI